MHDVPYEKVRVEAQEQERSICGFRQRLFTKDDGAPVSVTRLRTDNAEGHWHRNTHEYYYVLNGNGALEIDGKLVPVEPGDCVWIKPGHVHRAVGCFEALILGCPPFDYEDVILTRQSKSP